MPGRQNTEIEIYGMEGIPEEDLKNHEKQKQGQPGQGGNEVDQTCVLLEDKLDA